MKIDKNIFNQAKILVIGDAMIDRYFFGKVERQSPEADVPVVDIERIENKLGGAANVALNIKSLNAQVELICSIGKDESAQDFLQQLEENKIVAKRVLAFSKRPTTVKGRVYNAQNYMLRMDRENISDFTTEESFQLLQNIKKSIDEFKPDVAILQDYNKGLLTAQNIPEIIELLQNNDIKIAVDPKKDNFLAYKNVDLFKPNLKEISEALQQKIDATQKKDLEQMSVLLKEKLQCKNSLVTLSENGVVAFDEQNKYTHFPAFKRNVIDVSGAGDTVIAIASLFLALNFDIEKIAFYSNLAGGIVIEHKGVIALKIQDFLREVEKEGIRAS